MLKKKINRLALADFIAQLPKCLIDMEACGGSHYWERKFQSFGHIVRLISPQFVTLYVKGNKNDEKDGVPRRPLF